MSTQGNNEGEKDELSGSVSTDPNPASAPVAKGFTRVPPDERRCTHVFTEGDKEGQRCTSWAMREHEQGLCAGHGGKGVAASPEAARAAQLLSADSRREKASKPVRTAKQVYRAAVEKQAGRFVEIRLAIAEDERAPASDRLRAMEQLETRALGRPTEHVELETKTPQALSDLQGMSMDERLAFIRERSPALRAVGDD